MKWIALAWVMIASIFQLFFPLRLGLSNNGDFSKVSGYYKLAPTAGWGVYESEYYLPEYAFSDRNSYRSGLTSSEHIFAWPAVKISRLIFGKQSFSLLTLAAVKLIWYWLASAALLFALQSNWPALVLAALLTSDASLLTYLPGFYMDSAALLFTLSLVASLLWCHRGVKLAALPAAVSAAGLVFSKSQHAPLAFLFALALCWVAWRWRHRSLLLLAAGFCFLGTYMLRQTTDQYAAIPAFTFTFYRIAPTGDLMGLPPQYARYTGMHAYSAGSPVEDPNWSREFLQHTSLSRIARWYAAHPDFVLKTLWLAWRAHAGIQPDAGLGWRLAGQGHAARAQTGGFRPWSYLRIITTPLAFLALIWVRRQPILYLLAGAALCEFSVATLADALETARHLYLFQIFTDLLAVAATYFRLSAKP
jgi:hypothetical protein